MGRFPWRWRDGAKHPGTPSLPRYTVTTSPRDSAEHLRQAPGLFSSVISLEPIARYTLRCVAHSDLVCSLGSLPTDNERPTHFGSNLLLILLARLVSCS